MHFQIHKEPLTSNWVQTQKLHSLLNFPLIFLFFSLFQLFGVKNDEKADFNQHLECVTPKCWSKIITYSVLLVSCFVSTMHKDLNYKKEAKDISNNSHCSNIRLTFSIFMMEKTHLLNIIECYLVLTVLSKKSVKALKLKVKIKSSTKRRAVEINFHQRQKSEVKVESTVFYEKRSSIQKFQS